jgi:hypothetical protein
VESLLIPDEGPVPRESVPKRRLLHRFGGFCSLAIIPIELLAVITDPLVWFVQFGNPSNEIIGLSYENTKVARKPKFRLEIMDRSMLKVHGLGLNELVKVLRLTVGYEKRMNTEIR